MHEQLAKGFVAFMAPQRKGKGHKFPYGIGVTAFSADGREISMNFTFQSGQRFCCWASGCHHGLLLPADYQRLRKCFLQAGVEVRRPMKIYMRVVCESCALFAVNPSDSNPEYKPVTKAWETMEVYDEGAASY